MLRRCATAPPAFGMQPWFKGKGKGKGKSPGAKQADEGKPRFNLVVAGASSRLPSPPCSKSRRFGALGPPGCIRRARAPYRGAHAQQAISLRVR